MNASKESNSLQLTENLIQRSDDWFEARKGVLTASKFKHVFSKKPSVWLRLRNDIEYGNEFFGNKYTMWGEEHEDEARHLFSLFKNMSVDDVGLCIHPDFDCVGASPDGLIGDDAGIEIKCPYNKNNHEKFLTSKSIPTQYVAQVQGGMWVTGRSKWYFASYDPRQDVDHQIAWIEIERDEDYIKSLEERVKRFIDWWKHGGDIEVLIK